MNLWLRLLWVYWRAFRGKRLGLLEVSVVPLIVLPGDLDIYGHMNNGRYLTLMDLGRMDLLFRTGMGKIAGKHRWGPLVGQVTIRYRKSLKLFQPFEIHTRITGWDEKWFYIEQTFRRGRRELASASVQGLFRGPDGNVKPESVLHALHFNGKNPFLSVSAP